MQHEDSVSLTDTNKHRSLNVNYKFLSAALLVMAIGMLLIWRPWQFKGTSVDRTISVTGDATIKSTPDEYVFSPSYEFTSSDSKTALAQLTAKSDEVVKQLKALGVPDSAIKTSSDGNANKGGIYYYAPIATTDGTTTYNLAITVTLDSTTLLQKVQDYLVTTTPTGSVSPQTSFSTTKQKSLESQARNLAEKDARSKADQSAQNLGFKVAAVKTVEDGSLNLPQPMGIDNISSAVVGSAQKAPSLAVQPGQNDLSYSVSVVYFIR